MSEDTLLYIEITGVATMYSTEQMGAYTMPVTIQLGWNVPSQNWFVKKIVKEGTEERVV